MNHNLIVTIDGPMASGKSTISRVLQEKMSFQSMNTGAFYRASTYLVHSITGTEHLLTSLESIRDILDELIAVYIPFMKWIHNAVHFSKAVRILGQDYNRIDKALLFNQAIDSNVSLISSYVPLRKTIQTQVRKCVSIGKWTIEGRDAGTQIYPEAALKIYLDASVEVRARRRYQQYYGDNRDNGDNGDKKKYTEILEQLKKRDFQDKHKGLYSLQYTSDSIYLDSTKYTIEQISNILYTKLEKYNE